MPLIAYALVKALDLPLPMAISLLVVGCVPGGTTSNLFTMYAKSDVALSVSMTAVSTIAGVVIMPIVLGAYGQGFTSASSSRPSLWLPLLYALLVLRSATALTLLWRRSAV